MSVSVKLEHFDGNDWVSAGEFQTTELAWASLGVIWADLRRAFVHCTPMPDRYDCRCYRTVDGPIVLIVDAAGMVTMNEQSVVVVGRSSP